MWRKDMWKRHQRIKESVRRKQLFISLIRHSAFNNLSCFYCWLDGLLLLACGCGHRIYFVHTLVNMWPVQETHTKKHKTKKNRLPERRACKKTFAHNIEQRSFEKEQKAVIKREGKNKRMTIHQTQSTGFVWLNDEYLIKKNSFCNILFTALYYIRYYVFFPLLPVVLLLVVSCLACCVTFARLPFLTWFFVSPMFISIFCRFSVNFKQ